MDTLKFDAKMFNAIFASQQVFGPLRSSNNRVIRGSGVGRKPLVTAKGYTIKRIEDVKVFFFTECYELSTERLL